MKSSEAAGLSGIVVEMIKTADATGATMIHYLATTIICNDRVPTDKEQSFIVCLYKGKGGTLEIGNYQNLKLIKHATKSLDRIADGLIRQVVSFNDFQFRFSRNMHYLRSCSSMRNT